MAHRLRDTLDPAALVPARADAERAPSRLPFDRRRASTQAQSRAFSAAAGMNAPPPPPSTDYSLPEAVAALWQQLNRHVQPAVRVADLMSRGAQTLDAGAQLETRRPQNAPHRA